MNNDEKLYTFKPGGEPCCFRVDKPIASDLAQSFYKSPITINHVISDLSMDFNRMIEQYIVSQINQIEIHVDKEELLKALSYDRHQYEKGFEDGKKAAQRHGYWIHPVPGDGDPYCSECKTHAIWYGFGYFTSTCCPECGAIMDKEDSNECHADVERT